MSIDELTRKIIDQAKNRTHEERLQLLQEANILDSEGKLDRNFFRLEENLKNEHANPNQA
jgi:hypothetical protein